MAKKKKIANKAANGSAIQRELLTGILEQFDATTVKEVVSERLLVSDSGAVDVAIPLPPEVPVGPEAEIDETKKKLCVAAVWQGYWNAVAAAWSTFFADLSNGDTLEWATSKLDARLAALDAGLEQALSRCKKGGSKSKK